MPVYKAVCFGQNNTAESSMHRQYGRGRMAQHPLIEHIARFFRSRPGQDEVSASEVHAALRQAMREMSHQDRVTFRNLARLIYMNALNWNYNAKSNGEAWLIGKLAPNLGRVFDVGANEGNWTALVLAAARKAAVDAFEPTPDIAARLQARFAGESRLTVNVCGLFDRACQLRLHLNAVSSEYTSIWPTSPQAPVITVRATAGDAYMAERGVERIDLLKIDTEGAEKFVIDGFAEAFRRRSIDVIQLEYGPGNASSRWLLADMHAFFSASSYLLGRLYPDGVDFKNYTIDDETFIGGNYVACRADRTDLVRILTG